MRVIVTGAAGFIGRSLSATLLERGRLADEAGNDRAIEELVLVDREFVEAGRRDEHKGIRVVHMSGDISDARFIDKVMSGGADAVFHLAAALTLDSEMRDDAAYLVNVEAVRRFISSSTPSTRLVFASSIAVFGGELPLTVTDRERFSPTTTYGTHKAVVELLLADASRRGRVDARILRLPIVLIRPGANSPAVSDRIAAIVREPLDGKDVVSPLTAGTRFPVASAAAVARALMRLHDIQADMLPSSRAMNLPSLTVSIGEMIDSTQRHRGTKKLGTVRFAPDEQIQGIVDSWPTEFVSDLATRLGIVGDRSMDDIVFAYVSGRRAS